MKYRQVRKHAHASHSVSSFRLYGSECRHGNVKTFDGGKNENVANDVLKDQIVLAYISFTMKENLRMLNGFTRDNWLTSHRQLSVLPNVLIFGHGFRHYCCCLIMLIKCIQPTWTWFQSPSSVIFTLHKINMILFSLLAVCFLSAVISCLHCWRNYDVVKGEVTE